MYKYAYDILLNVLSKFLAYVQTNLYNGQFYVLSYLYTVWFCKFI